MKLAEALLEYRALKEHITFLSDYLCQNLTYKEGSQPQDNLDDLFKDLKTSLSRQEKLITMINLRNCITRVDNRTLTEMMAYRDALMSEIKIKQNILKNSSQHSLNTNGSSIKILSNLDSGKLRKEIDTLAKELRELNTKIQFTNWSTEL